MSSPKNLRLRRSHHPSYVQRYYIPRGIFRRTITELQRHGRKKREGLVFWAGGITENSSEAYITICIIPKKGNWGGGVRLDLNEILRLTEALIRRDLLLLAQIHSHPGDFGHSAGDEAKAASYMAGYISIVVPNFSQGKIVDLSNCYVYEYIGNLEWRLLPTKEVAKRFVIEDEVVRF